jgi:hypothetical protein
MERAHTDAVDATPLAKPRTTRALTFSPGDSRMQSSGLVKRAQALMQRRDLLSAADPNETADAKHNRMRTTVMLELLVRAPSANVVVVSRVLRGMPGNGGDVRGDLGSARGRVLPGTHARVALCLAPT